MVRKRQFMTDEVWHTILDHYIVPYRNVNRHCTPTLICHKDSEPLIDRKLPQRLRDLAAACPEMHIDVYSNGVLLSKWLERGEDFMDFLSSLPNRTRYLMSFHPFNHDGSVNDYTATIAYLKDVLQNRRPPNVEFITVSHKSKYVSEALQNYWRGTWAGLPITVHSNCSLNPWTGRIEEPGTVRFSGCPYGDFGHWFFGATGNVIACCLDLEEEIVFGNVMRDAPADMMARCEAFYADQCRAQAEGRKPAHAVCADCFGYKRGDLDVLQLGMGALR